MRRLHPLLLALVCCASGVFSSRLPAAETPSFANPRYTGVPFMRTWLAEDFGAGPSNRGVIQNPQTGFMYFANAAGLLEYDGVSWRLFPLPGGAGVGSLAVDALGRVRYSTDDHAGVLASTPDGDRLALSLKSQLPSGEALAFPTGSPIALPDGLYYTARDRLVRFSHEDGGQATTWKFPVGDRLWLMDGALHVRGPEGVFRFDGSGFKEVPGLKVFAFATRPDPAGGWQMLNRDGVRRWDGGYKSVAPGLPVLVSPLDGDIALCAAYLPDGRIVFGTNHRGLVIADAQGRKLQVIDRARGLLSDRVEAVCADREGGLWATFRNGIMRLQLDSPYARHGTGASRIENTPTALALHCGELYVGGGEGLWRRSLDGEFHAVADVPTYVRSLAPLGDQLFLTGLELRRIRDDRTALLGQNYFGLVPVSTSPGLVVHGTNDGLAFDRVDGSAWTPAGRLDKITGTTTALCEWPAGVVWVAHHNNGLWRVDLRAGASPSAPAKQYRAGQGVPPALGQYNAELYPWGSGLGGALAGKLLRYDEAADRWLPEDRIEGLPKDAGGVSNVWILGSRPGTDGTLWLQLRSPAAPIVQIVPTGPDRWSAVTPPGPALTHYFGTSIRHDAALHTLWLAGNGMLISRDLDWRPTTTPAPLTAVIRRVEQPDGRLVWGDGVAPALSQLPPAQTALRIQFTAPAFAGDYLGRTHTRFRTRLDGLDRDWSAWSEETQRDFTYLPYRAFTFQVQARDDQSRESTIATFAFSIAPPWWLTRWAFGGYVVIAALGIVGLVRWRTHALLRRAEKLETVVATRTEELRTSNTELARLHGIERDEKLAARLDEEKARLEVLRYQLNPHFLYNTLASICGTARTNPEATRTMAQRLADFCRLTLTRADEMESVREELRMLQSYLDIEKARWRDSLQIEIDVAEAALDHRLPTFLLLPLLENAIKHGALTTRGTLHLRLSIHPTEGGLRIEVANTGTWDTVTPNPNSTGIGLENLRRRLARHFPGTHTFTIGPEGDRVVARLLIAGGAHRMANKPLPTT